LAERWRVQDSRAMARRLGALKRTMPIWSWAIAAPVPTNAGPPGSNLHKFRLICYAVDQPIFAIMGFLAHGDLR
jgi:hypothetical protein